MLNRCEKNLAILLDDKIKTSNAYETLDWKKKDDWLKRNTLAKIFTYDTRTNVIWMKPVNNFFHRIAYFIREQFIKFFYPVTENSIFILLSNLRIVFEGSDFFFDRCVSDLLVIKGVLFEEINVFFFIEDFPNQNVQLFGLVDPCLLIFQRSMFLFKIRLYVGGKFIKNFNILLIPFDNYWNIFNGKGFSIRYIY